MRDVLFLLWYFMHLLLRSICEVRRRFRSQIHLSDYVIAMAPGPTDQVFKNTSQIKNPSERILDR